MTSIHEYNRNVIASHPYPTADPVDRLRHVVSLFADSGPGEVAVMATSGIYPGDATVDGRNGGLTGLTHGDLRALLQLFGG